MAIDLVSLGQCACMSASALQCARIRYGLEYYDADDEPCECSCHDESNADDMADAEEATW